MVGMNPEALRRGSSAFAASADADSGHAGRLADVEALSAAFAGAEFAWNQRVLPQLDAIRAALQAVQEGKVRASAGLRATADETVAVDQGFGAALGQNDTSPQGR